MARDLREIYIIDLEATCYTDAEKEANPNLVSEIIEIGISVVDLKLLIIKSTESILVKPTKSQISKFCTELTTITPEMVVNSPTFPEAIKQLKKIKIQNKTWGSWGDYDREQFKRNNELYSQNSNYLGRTHLNIKNWFSLMNGYSKEFGMDEALKILGLPLEGTHHRAGSDSQNIAQIFINTVKKFRNDSS